VSVVGGIVWFMLVYSLTTAFEDVSLVVRSGVVLDRTTAGAARPACCTRWCAPGGRGPADDPQRWPGGHPAAWIVETMRHAGPAQVIEDSGTRAKSSPWALREAANEMRIGLCVQDTERLVVDVADRHGQRLAEAPSPAS
jgi:hypothetical protein